MATPSQSLVFNFVGLPGFNIHNVVFLKQIQITKRTNPNFKFYMIKKPKENSQAKRFQKKPNVVFGLKKPIWQPCGRFVPCIERVLYFLRLCVEPPVRIILGGGGWSELMRIVAHRWSAALRAVVLLLCIFHISSLQLPVLLMVCIVDWITVCILERMHKL